MTRSASPGGRRLRTLREFLKKTQLEVELDANLGTGYLQRVESGKVQNPERDTLERVLVALGAGYSERRGILELFGYVVDVPLPTEAEIKWAIASCATELDSAEFPAYLLDCGHQLLAWNSFFPKVFQMAGAKKQRPPDGRVSMLRLLFDPAFGVTPHIANPAVFFPAAIRALRSEMQLFQGARWYQPLLTDLRLSCPLFEKYWLEAETGPGFQIAARPLTPLALRLSETDSLQFSILAEPFSQDRRFRLIYCLPANSATIQKCERWAHTESPQGD